MAVADRTGTSTETMTFVYEDTPDGWVAVRELGDDEVQALTQWPGDHPQYLSSVAVFLKEPGENTQ